MEPHASGFVTFGIAGIALAVAGALVVVLRGHERPGRRAAGVVIAWLLVSALLALSGVLADFRSRPPPLLLILGPTLGMPIALALSSLGARLAASTPLWMLIGVHAFRLPLELVMHRAALEGTMPPQMTFTGYNFDIVTGGLAIGAAWVAYRPHPPRGVVLAFNALGTALLLAIVGIAVASLPVVAAFGPEALNTWVAYFPFVWLPAILVSTALLAHLLLWRRLAAPRPDESATA